MHRMPCHISDGPQTPEDVHNPIEPDEDEIYERHRQAEIDDQPLNGDTNDRSNN